MRKAFLSPDKLASANRLRFCLMSLFATPFHTKTAFFARRGWIRLAKFHNIQPFCGSRKGIKFTEHNGSVMNGFWCCSCVQTYRNNDSVELGVVRELTWVQTEDFQLVVDTLPQFNIDQHTFMLCHIIHEPPPSKCSGFFFFKTSENVFFLTKMLKILAKWNHTKICFVS